MSPDPDPLITQAWDFLKMYTDARIALGRVGHAIPTSKLLEFEKAHAQAKDAVYSTLDVEMLKTALEAYGLEVLCLETQAEDRITYLKRPDLGRRLSTKSKWALETSSWSSRKLNIVIADGLSAQAITVNLLPFIKSLLPLLQKHQISLAPITIVTQARVAVSDEIGALFGTEMSVILIGERPGLSAPDSMGIYLTYGPKLSNSDEKRNCISNVRPRGLHWEYAAHKLMHLMLQSFALQLSGVALKDTFEHKDWEIDKSGNGALQ